MKARTLSTILILSMLIPTLVSCNTDTPETPDDSGTTAAVSDTVDTDAPEEEFIPHYTYTPTVAQNPDLYIVEDGTSDYVIVRGENASPS
ncbi:MAG: hypothetical protein IJC98_02785, partial [Clostridia bacterium]|nr:hypothetical protein [Clostridia bacterium]